MHQWRTERAGRPLGPPGILRFELTRRIAVTLTSPFDEAAFPVSGSPRPAVAPTMNRPSPTGMGVGDEFPLIPLTVQRRSPVSTLRPVTLPTALSSNCGLPATVSRRGLDQLVAPIPGTF